MYKKYWLIACLCSLISCRKIPPKGILTEEKMRDVLVDLKLAKCSLPYREGQRDKPIQAEALYAYALRKNGTTESDFEKSNRYYTEHPQRYIDIMNAVLDSLTKLKSQVDQIVKTDEKTLKTQPPAGPQVTKPAATSPPIVPIPTQAPTTQAPATQPPTTQPSMQASPSNPIQPNAKRHSQLSQANPTNPSNQAIHAGQSKQPNPTQRKATQPTQSSQPNSTSPSKQPTNAIQSNQANSTSPSKQPNHPQPKHRQPNRQQANRQRPNQACWIRSFYRTVPG